MYLATTTAGGQLLPPQWWYQGRLSVHFLFKRKSWSKIPPGVREQRQVSKGRLSGSTGATRILLWKAGLLQFDSMHLRKAWHLLHPGMRSGRMHQRQREVQSYTHVAHIACDCFIWGYSVSYALSLVNAWYAVAYGRAGAMHTRHCAAPTIHPSQL